ncbi:hypothetical protein [Variovorax sp. PAMC26660]|uniref:hypothetical protein n=1 Tax=Variovorax sp. PAMC26660 TaxID=2762322 RepID=UPI00164DC297|nr:hypothetical protein [Variovorax sp. PAMC26660]QNK69188.1 hypothetical protein H7F35_05600 [Variovorax sp. PAMC26660]
MTSIVDTSVKHFGSFMGAAAPALNGTAGTLEALVYACLVTGFDTKTLATLTVSGGVATASYSGTHSARTEAVVLIAGVTGALTALNGEQKIVAKPNAGSVQFATAAPDGVAAGTITMKIAPLGWLRPFSGPNLGVYKSADPASSGMFLRMNDADPVMCRVVGYESMADVSTGVGAWPRENLIPGGGVWGKSAVANTNPISWVLVGDSRAFYLHVSTYMGNGVGSYDRYAVGSMRGFGDMLAFKPAGDPYACALAAYFNATTPTQWVSYPAINAFDNASGGVWTPRNHTGLGSPFAMAPYPYTGLPTTVSGTDATMGAFPSRVDGKLRLSRRYLRSLDETQPEPRCEVPGLLTIPQSYVVGQINHLEIVPATGELAGRKLMGLAVGGSYSSDPTLNNNTAGLALVDITGPWR